VKEEQELNKLAIFPSSKRNESVSSWSTFRGGLPHFLYYFSGDMSLECDFSFMSTLKHLDAWVNDANPSTLSIAHKNRI